ncbi:MAG: hypothetical protein GY906_38660 [bacterium]|nr:hypothetical protein [bacterium]
MATRKKRRSAAQKRATKKLVALNRARARKRSPARKRRRRNPVVGGRTTAAAPKRRSTKRRRAVASTTRRSTMPTRRRKTARRNPVRRKKTTRRRRPVRRATARRRTYRRNPAFRMPAIVPTLMTGVRDAGSVVLGKGLSNIIAGFIPINGGMAIQVAKQAGSALAVAVVAQQFLGKDIARFMVAGALAAPIEGFIKGAGIPFVSDALGSYPVATAGMGAYPQMGAYPMLNGYGDGDLGQAGASAEVVEFQQGMQ